MVTSAIAGTVAAQTLQLFDDVPRGHYAYDAVQWAVENGITEGCGDGRNFCPEQPLARAQMVTFLKRYHDKFASGASPGSVASPGSSTTGTQAEYMLDGWGSDEESISLAAGRYSVSLALEHDKAIQTDFDAIALTVEDSNGRPATLLTVDTSSSNSAFDATTKSFAGRASFVIGPRLGQLDPGRVYFAVKLTGKDGQTDRASWAEWEIVVSER